jgi:hypothetical protein
MKATHLLFVISFFLFSCNTSEYVECNSQDIHGWPKTSQKAYLSVGDEAFVIDFVKPESQSLSYKWSFAGGPKDSDVVHQLLSHLKLDYQAKRVISLNLFFPDRIRHDETKVFNVKDRVGLLVYYIDNENNVVGAIISPAGELLGEFFPTKISAFRSAYILYELIGAPYNKSSNIRIDNLDLFGNRNIEMNFASKPGVLESKMIRKAKVLKANLEIGFRAPDCPSYCNLGPLDECDTDPYSMRPFECDNIFDDDGPCEEESMYLALNENQVYINLADSLEDVMSDHYAFRDSFLKEVNGGYEFINLYYNFSAKIKQLSDEGTLNIPISLRVKTARFLVLNSYKLNLLSNFTNPEYILIDKDELEEIIGIIDEYASLSTDIEYIAMLDMLKNELYKVVNLSAQEI